MTNEQISFRDFLDSKVIELRDYFNVRFEAADRARDVALVAMEKRLDGMNEFREALKDQSVRFITRDEVEGRISRMDATIKSLELSKAQLEGKANQSALNSTLFISVIGLALSVVNLILVLWRG